MSREGNLVKNTFIIMMGTFLPKLTTLITLPILTQYLTKAEYGIFDLIGTLLSLVLPLATLKIEAAAFRFLIDCRGDEDGTREVVSTIFLFLLPVMGSVSIFAFLAAHGMTFELRVLLGLYFLCDVCVSAMQQVARGLSQNVLYSASAIVLAVANMLFLLLLVKGMKKGLEGALLAMVLALILAAGLLLWRGGWRGRIRLSAFSGKRLKQLLHYSWPMIPNSLSFWVMNLSDRWLITYYMGIEANAVYAVANKIPNLVAMLQTTFALAWQENASEAVKDRDAGTYYSEMFEAFFSLLAGAMAALFAVTPILFGLLIDGQYQEAYPQLPILLAAMMFATLSSFLGGIYTAHKRTRNVGATTILAALCNMAVNFLFIRTLGLYAASLSTLVSYLFLTIYRMCDVRRFEGMTYQPARIVGRLAVLMGMGVLCACNVPMFNIFNFIFGLGYSFFSCRKILCPVVKREYERLRQRKVRR